MTTLQHAYTIFSSLIDLCNCPASSLSESKTNSTVSGYKLTSQSFMANLTETLKVAHFIVPTLTNLTPNIDGFHGAACGEEGHVHRVFPGSPTFLSIEGKVEIMNSLQKPKRIWVRTNEGTTVSFLCKSKDEPRKDIRMMEVAGLLNTLFRSGA
uniref:Protein kinase rad3 n=1 Tax=Lygus hesperus TaxID=30085 RepID=A0A0A9X8N0_LYGHE